MDRNDFDMQNEYDYDQKDEQFDSDDLKKKQDSDKSDEKPIESSTYFSSFK